MDTPYTYEVEYDVQGACRSEYEQWLADDSLEWVSHDAVAAFSVRYNNNGFSPEVKLCFGFQSLKSWATFLNSPEHRATTETLQSVVTSLDGTLWERGGISLLPPDADGGKQASAECPNSHGRPTARGEKS